jgi:hypothetical protein
MRAKNADLETDVAAYQVYLAGQKVPPGTYRQIEGDREIRLDQEDVLPASCDGHVSAYRRRPETWGERQKRAQAE